MKRNHPIDFTGYLLLNREQKENAKHEAIPIKFDLVYLIFCFFQIRRYSTSLCLVLFFSFFCMMPQMTQAQQTETSILEKEKKSSSIEKLAEEEEEEGTLEAEAEHQRSGWYKSMQKKNVNYFKVKRQFDNYFKNHPVENSKPRQRYEDWLKTQVFYLDKKGRVVAPPAINYNAVQKMAATT